MPADCGSSRIASLKSAIALSILSLRRPGQPAVAMEPGLRRIEPDRLVQVAQSDVNLLLVVPEHRAQRIRDCVARVGADLIGEIVDPLGGLDDLAGRGPSAGPFCLGFEPEPGTVRGFDAIEAGFSIAPRHDSVLDAQNKVVELGQDPVADLGVLGRLLGERSRRHGQPPADRQHQHCQPNSRCRSPTLPSVRMSVSSNCVDP